MECQHTGRKYYPIGTLAIEQNAARRVIPMPTIMQSLERRYGGEKFELVPLAQYNERAFVCMAAWYNARPEHERVPEALMAKNDLHFKPDEAHRYVSKIRFQDPPPQRPQRVDNSASALQPMEIDEADIVLGPVEDVSERLPAPVEPLPRKKEEDWWKVGNVPPIKTGDFSVAEKAEAHNRFAKANWSEVKDTGFGRVLRAEGFEFWSLPELLARTRIFMCALDIALGAGRFADLNDALARDGYAGLSTIVM
ncbi:MAG: hypothetical protein NZ605_12115, partial [Acidimicrobiales bacterium]|nr:hypothetical protein [Acidimicrobiales bacterium]